MKQITSDKFYSMPRLFLSACMVLSLSVFSMVAVGAEQDAAQPKREFNHMDTGFPLTGMHTTTECASCHVGGVFKGTPRNCAGCHTKGKRIVAPAMSAKHIVTTEACEVCHTNAVTFYGAKYNHGKAVAGQCATCHNGLVATARAASHTSGKKLTEACDSCHRTYAWIPASWNHTSSAACTTCHSWTTGVNTPVKSNHTATTLDCGSCHLQTGWLPATFRHSGAISGVCGTCHYSGGTGKAKTAISNHIPETGGNACDVCHTSTTSFATYSMSHTYVVSTCKTCHNTGTVYPVSTKKTLGSHEGSSASQDCNSSGCHTKGISWSH